jgi:LuxR family transcriptional regulator
MVAYDRGLCEAGEGAEALALRVEALAPAGHSVALRVRMTYPAELRHSWPEAWIRRYQAEALMLVDPVFHWACTGTGAVRWSGLAERDSSGVLALAAEYGLRFGLVVAVPGEAGERSWGVFAREDREFTDAEVARLQAHVAACHRSLAPPRNITQAELDALRLLKDGQRLKQIAWSLSVSEGAVKQRLRSVRGKLDVRTGAEAISRASALRLI